MFAAYLTSLALIMPQININGDINFTANFAGDGWDVVWVILSLIALIRAVRR